MSLEKKKFTFHLFCFLATRDAEDEPPKEEVTKPNYRHADITNREDNKIRGELDWANDINDVVSSLLPPPLSKGKFISSESENFL